jgi:arylsulfate sulfotransferase
MGHTELVVRISVLSALLFVMSGCSDDDPFVPIEDVGGDVVEDVEDVGDAADVSDAEDVSDTDDEDARDVGDTEDAADADADTAPNPVVIESITIEDNPNSELSAYMNVRTSRPAFVAVRAEAGGHDFELDFDDQARADQRLVLVGFRPDRSYALTVRVHTADGAEATAQRTFQSGPLPADFAPIETTISQPARMQPGVTLFNLYRHDAPQGGPWGYIVGVDEHGEVVWYHSPEHPAQAVIMLQNGNLAFNNPQHDIVEIDLAGEVVRRWTPAQLGVDYLHHEVYQMPNGNLVGIASELRWIGGYPEGTLPVVGDVVVEFTRGGDVVRKHSMFDILDPHRWGQAGFTRGYWNPRYQDEAPGGTRDWTHGNGVVYDPSDDSFLVSLRHQDWVIKIDRQTGELIWRFGFEGDFELVEGQWFFHQHQPALVEGGNILLYDNGGHRPGVPSEQWFSRVVEYDIDPSGADPQAGTRGVARQVWEFRDDQPYYSPFLSGVEKLDNGNVLVADGVMLADRTILYSDPGNLMFVRIVEVTDDDNPTKVFEVRVRDEQGQVGYTMYRATRVDLYGNAPARGAAGQ